MQDTRRPRDQTALPYRSNVEIVVVVYSVGYSGQEVLATTVRRDVHLEPVVRRSRGHLMRVTRVHRKK